MDIRSKLPYLMLLSSDKVTVNTATNLIIRIHHLYSSLSFSALGNLKYLQVWLTDEWLHDGAKPYTISVRLDLFLITKAIINVIDLSNIIIIE